MNVSANVAGMNVNAAITGATITVTIIAMTIVVVITITIIIKQKIPLIGGIFLLSRVYQPSASPTSK
jgi:hypothetical protein